MTKIVVIFACISLLAAVPCSADVIYVKEGGTGSGSSWDDPNGVLQCAINNANSNDEVWVAAGTYKPTIKVGGSSDRYKTFQMKNGVEIYGGFGNTGYPDMADRDPNMYKTILNGEFGTTEDPNDNCYHIFYHPSGTNLNASAVLNGFTITGGNANVADYYEPGSKGGGMYNEDCSPTVINCTFTGNSAGVYSGGGMYNSGGSPTVIGCTFIGNSANNYGSGGGMYNWNNSPTVTNCTFTGNLADRANGGGMVNSYSSPKVTNCTFTGNSARYGGGMYNWSSSPTVTNCTFTGNSARGGGGMCNWYNSSPTVTNCILWANTAPNGSQIYNRQGSSPTVTYSDVQGGYSGTGNINADPLFVNPGYWDPNGTPDITYDDFWVDGNYHLLPTSPCIDAANGNVAPATDILGQSRYDDPNTPNTGVGDPNYVDMGAYEFIGVCGDPYHPYPVGDINNDCAVDISDAVILALAWLSEDGQPRWNPACNLYEADSIIDASDFAILQAHWLECTKPECD